MFKSLNNWYKKLNLQKTKFGVKLGIVFLLFIPDFFAIVITCIISYQLRFKGDKLSKYSDSLIPSLDYRLILVIISMGWMIALIISGIYSFKIANFARLNQYKLVRTTIFYFFLIGFSSFTLNASFSRQIFVSMFILGLLNLVAIRLLIHLVVIRKLIYGKKVVMPIIIIGKSQIAIDQHVDWIIEHRQLGYKVVGSIRCEEIDFAWISEFDKLRSRQSNFEVLLLPGMESDRNFPKFIHYLEDLSIHVNWIPLDSGNLGYWLIPSKQDSLPFLTFENSQITRGQQMIKRLFDIVFSTVFLLFFLPILVLISLVILFADGRPIFFSQTRIGRNGTPFKILKFRSMVSGAEHLISSIENTKGSEHILFKNTSDPRVTKIGRVLRKYSLDELPQFVNVFLGDMSVVGPRPALPKEVGIYSSLYERRLIAKPGITGPWQISGRSDLDLQTSVALDLNYLLHWSFTSDLWIILATIGVVVKGKGAY